MTVLPPTPVPEPTPTPAPTPEPEPTTYKTQADVDRVVEDRLARERKKYADYDDLKAKAGKFDELDAANKTELEKATEKARLADERATKADERVNKTLRESAISLAAIKLGAADPADVVSLLPKDAVTVGDDGQVTGVEDAVKALLEKKPHLVGKSPTPTGDPDGGGRGKSSPSQLSRDDLKTMTPEAINQAHKEGRLNDVQGIT